MIFRHRTFPFWPMLVLTSLPSMPLWADSYQDRLEKAVSFYSDKQYSAAAAQLQPLVESDPTRKEAYLWLGHARAELQDWTAAREAYKKYAELAPKDIEGPRGVARSYEGEGKKDLALLWYRKALELEPGNKRLRRTVDQLANEDPSEGLPQSSSGPPAAAQTREGFWKEGVAGRLGARNVWWGRLIAVVLFAMWLLNGAQHGTRILKERMPNLSSGAVALQYAFSTVLLYIVYWGIPDGFEWGLMALSLLAGLTVVRATSQ
jgi:tetratricopeptide (TPR) repeat protein